MPESNDGLLKRTVGCGELGEADAAARREVVLTGWIHRRRDLGRLIFVEVRDPTGTVQVVFDPSHAQPAHAVAESLRAEFVVGVRGVVIVRESPNPKHPSGTVEVRADEIVIHNRADHLPIPVADEGETNEEARLTHRYIDLRRPAMQYALRLRHRLAVAARGVLDRHGFTEIETPMLTRSTPEGARDYLVPSRVQPGSFYALPQSPQLFKQLLMIAGYDRYFQFARCFRDEDLRADRQPEFTQIDIEMSFVRRDDVYVVVEELLREMFARIGVTIEPPFRRMSYYEAMDRFGTDRPDLRFGMELRDPGESVRDTGFRVFEETLAAGGAIRGLAVPGGADVPRKQIDEWTDYVRRLGARGLVWIKLEQGTVGGSVKKALGDARCRAIATAVGASDGDLALLVADTTEVARSALGALRLRVAADRGAIPSDRWELLWVEQFPLFGWDAGQRRHVAIHHPFTAPEWDQLALMESDPAAVRSQAYDVVLNGTELGGGSIRIHRRDVQDRVFRALGIDEEEARAKFGFLLQALDSGAPPHGGIALGFDRICALMAGHESIREVIAFPKTTRASCLMTGSPSAVDPRQLRELGITLVRD
ncbi:MAG TPA: aspartate--tRNA ligase [Candidatus Polarisedimenticolaceae bacterium]|nr:aspartate--tRNA ligase [Candidatus Polarisedimenticolaceae bacterium]